MMKMTNMMTMMTNSDDIYDDNADNYNDDNADDIYGDIADNYNAGNGDDNGDNCDDSCVEECKATEDGRRPTAAVAG